MLHRIVFPIPVSLLNFKLACSIFFFQQLNVSLDGSHTLERQYVSNLIFHYPLNISTPFPFLHFSMLLNSIIIYPSAQAGNPVVTTDSYIILSRTLPANQVLSPLGATHSIAYIHFSPFLVQVSF